MDTVSTDWAAASYLAQLLRLPLTCPVANGFWEGGSLADGWLNPSPTGNSILQKTNRYIINETNCNRKSKLAIGKSEKMWGWSSKKWLSSIAELKGHLKVYGIQTSSMGGPVPSMIGGSSWQVRTCEVFDGPDFPVASWRNYGQKQDYHSIYVSYQCFWFHISSFLEPTSNPHHQITPRKKRKEKLPLEQLPPQSYLAWVQASGPCNPEGSSDKGPQIMKGCTTRFVCTFLMPQFVTLIIQTHVCNTANPFPLNIKHPLRNNGTG